MSWGFEIGRVYSRQADSHAKYGGQEQGGAAAETTEIRPSPEFWSRSIFDVFNSIGTCRTSRADARMFTPLLSTW